MRYTKGVRTQAHPERAAPPCHPARRAPRRGAGGWVLGPLVAMVALLACSGQGLAQQQTFSTISTGPVASPQPTPTGLSLTSIYLGLYPPHRHPSRTHRPCKHHCPIPPNRPPGGTARHVVTHPVKPPPARPPG